LGGSPADVGTRRLDYGSGSLKPGFAGLHLDYQPPFLQFGLGTFGFGGTLEIYPGQGPTDSNGQRNFVYALGAGGQVRYEARFGGQQTWVPIAAYTWERFRYRLRTGVPDGTFTARGPTLGLWLLLNSLNRSTAEDFFAEHGVSHTYLVAEWQRLTGSDEAVSLAGDSYYFGIRFEF
jgi:hypothetical protein